LSQFSPKDFFEVSKNIHDALKTPEKLLKIHSEYITAWIRTGISRAYYAAFLLTNDISGYRFGGKNAHDQLCRVLKTMRGVYAKIGSKLNSLRKRRLQADYNLAYKPSLGELQWAVKTAEDIIAKACKFWQHSI